MVKTLQGNRIEESRGPSCPSTFKLPKVGGHYPLPQLHNERVGR